MTTQEREIVDLLWDNDQADALDKLKDMLQVKAAMAVDASKQDVATRMFPHVPDDSDHNVDPATLYPEQEPQAELDTNDQEDTDETDQRTD
tara:strand:- start:129 stop:401 length:273 start_codon:yes stop_codon:yes gene_type:complete